MHPVSSLGLPYSRVIFGGSTPPMPPHSIYLFLPPFPFSLPLCILSALTEDDYFRRNAEFRRWLRKEKGRYFEDLDGDRAREYFSRFIRAWNEGDLSDRYYSGMRTTQTSSGKDTRYKWGFVDRLDQRELEGIRKSVDDATYGASSLDPGKERGRPGEGPERDSEGLRRPVAGKWEERVRFLNNHLAFT